MQTQLRESNGLLHVTEVIALNGLYKGTDYMLPEHRERGQAVHLACEYFDKGTYDDYEWDPVVVPYVDSWKAFVKETGFRSVLIEEKMRSRIYSFVGIVDRIGTIDADAWIIDLKTGTDQKASKYQTAGYHLLAAESGKFVELAPKKVCRGTVELFADGRCGKLHPHNDRTDIQKFVCLLVSAQIRQEFGVSL